MKRAVAFATLLVALLAIAARLDPVREGLNGSHYANPSWTGPSVASTRDPQPSNARLVEAWHGATPPQFSATWAGSFLAMRDGPYVLPRFPTMGRRSTWTWQATRGWPRRGIGTQSSAGSGGRR